MLKEEQRLRMFENEVPRRIFGPKRDEVADGHNYIIKNFILYHSPYIVRVIKSKARLLLHVH
jgi:hypothetical protein